MHKPKLKKVSYCSWTCTGEHGTAYGITFDKAWFNYLRLAPCVRIVFP